MIDYSGVPNLVKLGYEIIAVVFGKRNYQKHPDILHEAGDFAKRHPNIIFGADGIGFGYDRISVSIHKDYSDFCKFMNELRAELGEALKVDSFLINLSSKGVLQPLSLKRFAEQLIEKKEPE
jgi:hypothetical protein